jgi:hypothetical protein
MLLCLSAAALSDYKMPEKQVFMDDADIGSLFPGNACISHTTIDMQRI